MQLKFADSASEAEYFQSDDDELDSDYMGEDSETDASMSNSKSRDDDEPIDPIHVAAEQALLIWMKEIWQTSLQREARSIIRTRLTGGFKIHKQKISM